MPRVPNVTYVVRFDPTRGKFIALDEEGNLLGVDLSRNMTIGSAYGAAIRASLKDGVRVTIMVEDEKGRRKRERVVEPPP